MKHIEVVAVVFSKIGFENGYVFCVQPMEAAIPHGDQSKKVPYLYDLFLYV